MTDWSHFERRFYMLENGRIQDVGFPIKINSKERFKCFVYNGSRGGNIRIHSKPGCECFSDRAVDPIRHSC